MSSNLDYPTDEKDHTAGAGGPHFVPAAEDDHAGVDPRYTHHPYWYHSTWFNAFVVGLVTFMGVGMFTALQNTGAGGLANVNTANASLALAWGPMIPFSWCASAFISKLGPRYALMYGACGYILYGAALYTNSKYGNQWYLMFGAFLSAITSGVFFPTEGAIITIYPEPWYKGRALAMWQSIYRSSNIIGGIINMAFNAQNKKTGGLTPNTYLVFVGLMAAAPLCTMLLSHPEQVQRTDGSKVPDFPKESIWTEFKETMLTLKDPKILCLCVLWAQPLFAPALLGTVLGKRFSVRVRALNSIVLPVLEVVMFQIMGYYLDKTRASVRRRMTVVWTVLNALSLATMVWMFVNIYLMVHRYPTRTWDWSSSGFAQVYISILLATACPYVCLGFYYALAGYSFPLQSSGVRMTRVMGQLRAAEAGGAAVGYGLLAGGVGWVAVGACNIALLVACCITGGFLLIRIRKQDLAGAFDFDERPGARQAMSEPEAVTHT